MDVQQLITLLQKIDPGTPVLIKVEDYCGYYHATCVAPISVCPIGRLEEGTPRFDTGGDPIGPWFKAVIVR